MAAPPGPRASWAWRCANWRRKRSAKPACPRACWWSRPVAAAALAGVQPGDVLVAVNGTPAKSVEQVRDVVAQSGKSVALLIQRDGPGFLCPYVWGKRVG